MKTFILTIVVTLSFNASLPAFPPGPRSQHGEIKSPIAPGDLAPLEALADKFAAFRKANLYGESFYSKPDAELQKQHGETYTLISDSMISDRISETQGAIFISELIRLGSIHKSMQKDAAALTPEEKNAGAKSLTELQAKIKEAIVEEVATEILTPEINKVQLKMHELSLFAQSDEKLASKTSSLNRRFNEILDDEKKIKEDRKVSDREREKMMSNLTVIWAQYIAILKR